MSEGNIPINYSIRWQRNQVLQKTNYDELKTNYDKMLVITFLSFRSTRFLMACLPVVMFDRKLASSHRFDYFFLKIIFFIIY